MVRGSLVMGFRESTLTVHVEKKPTLFSVNDH